MLNNKNNILLSGRHDPLIGHLFLLYAQTHTHHLFSIHVQGLQRGEELSTS